MSVVVADKSVSKILADAERNELLCEWDQRLGFTALCREYERDDVTTHGFFLWSLEGSYKIPLSQLNMRRLLKF